MFLLWLNLLHTAGNGTTLNLVVHHTCQEIPDTKIRPQYVNKAQDGLRGLNKAEIVTWLQNYFSRVETLLTCQRRKSLSLTSPEVRIRSSGSGDALVYKLLPIISSVTFLKPKPWTKRFNSKLNKLVACIGHLQRVHCADFTKWGNCFHCMRHFLPRSVSNTHVEKGSKIGELTSRLAKFILHVAPYQLRSFDRHEGLFTCCLILWT